MKIDREINSLKQQNHKVLHNLNQGSPKTTHNQTLHFSDSPMHQGSVSPVNHNKNSLNTRPFRESHGGKELR